MTDPSPRNRLLAAASELFCRLGFHAVGVDAIVEKAGTAKATLYKLFGSKEALVEAVLDHEGRIWRDWFIGALDAGPGNARERLDRIAPLLGQWFAEDRFYGCPFINAVGEHDKVDERVRRLALAHKSVVLARIGSLLDEAGATDSAAVSHQVGLIMDGAIVAALVTRNPAVGKTAGHVLACVLDVHLRPRRSNPQRRQRQAVA